MVLILRAGNGGLQHHLRAVGQRIVSMSLVGLTFRPCASFTMLSRLTFRSPRSAPPT